MVIVHVSSYIHNVNTPKNSGSLNALSFAMLEALLELTQMLLITLTLKE